MIKTLILAISLAVGPICKPPDFNKVKQVEQFVDKNLSVFDKDIKHYGKVVVKNIYLPDNGDMAIVVLEFSAMNIRQATVVATLTWSQNQWIVCGFTLRDEGLWNWFNKQ